MIKKLTGTAVLFIISLIYSSGIYANYGETYGFSAKGIAMGNAMCASVNDWSSVFYNMAGLGRTKMKHPAFTNSTSVAKPGTEGTVKLEKKSEVQGQEFGASQNDQFAINYLYTKPVMNIDIGNEVWKENNAAGPDENLAFGTIEIGLVLDLNHFMKMPSIISSARFGLGMGTNLYMKEDGDGNYELDTSLVKVNDIDLRTHNFIMYGREAQSVTINAGLGLGFLNDFFGIGFGVTASAKGTGTMLVREAEFGSETQYPYAEVEMEQEGAMAPVVGIYVHPLSFIEVGATFRDELHLSIAPLNAATFTQALPDKGAYMIMNVFDYYIPRIFSAGVSVSLSDFKISIECSYETWSQSKVGAGRESEWEALRESAAEDEKYLYEIPELKDIIIPKIGVSWQLFKNIAVMAGYYYKPSVLSDDTSKGLFNYMDNDKHVGSLGVQFVIPKVGGMVSPLEINLAFQFQYLVKTEVTKDESAVSESNPANYSYSGFVPSSMIEIVTRW